MQAMKMALLVTACFVITGMAQAADEGLLGVWVLKQEVRGEEREYTLTLSESGGTWTDGRSTSELSDVTLENETVSFERIQRRGGRETSIRYDGALVDGNIVGKIVSPRGESEFIAARIPESVLQAIEARSKAIDALKTCDILAVFAHPDDETFAIGTFSKLSANGQKIQLVYATSGDAGGDLTGQGLSGADLGQWREGEMNAAAEVIGVSAKPLFLRYPDGYVRKNWDDVLGNVESIIAKTQPKIVVTFGPDGYYGHSDHLAIGQIAERAFDELGIGSHLLHVAIPKSMNDKIKQAGGGDRYKAVNDRYITYIVNVKKQIQQRVGAMKAHGSQFDEQTVAQMQMLGALTGIEGFVEVRNLGESGTLSDLFSKGDVVRKRR